MATGLFATFSLGDAVRLRASRPDVHRLAGVPKAHKRHQGRSLRHLAQCRQHGLPASRVIRRRDVNGQDREVGVGLSLGLQGVHERLRSCPRGECIQVWVASCIKLLRELLSQGAGDQSPQQIAHNKPAGASRRLAKSNKSSQGNCSGDRCRHLSSGEEGGAIRPCISASPRCGAFACVAEVSDQSGSIKRNWCIRLEIQEVRGQGPVAVPGSAFGVGQLTQGFGNGGLLCCGQCAQTRKVGSALSTPSNIITGRGAVQADRASLVEGGTQLAAPIALEKCREPGEELLFRHLR